MPRWSPHNVVTFLSHAREVEAQLLPECSFKNLL